MPRAPSPTRRLSRRHAGGKRKPTKKLTGPAARAAEIIIPGSERNAPTSSWRTTMPRPLTAAARFHKGRMRRATKNWAGSASPRQSAAAHINASSRRRSFRSRAGSEGPERDKNEPTRERSGKGELGPVEAYHQLPDQDRLPDEGGAAPIEHQREERPVRLRAHCPASTIQACDYTAALREEKSRHPHAPARVAADNPLCGRPRSSAPLLLYTSPDLSH